MRSLERKLGTNDEEKAEPPSYEQIKLQKLKSKYSDLNLIAERYKGRKTIVTTPKTKIHRAVFQLTLLALEIVFFAIFLHLLKHQYHYQTSWLMLLKTGKLFQEDIISSENFDLKKLIFYTIERLQHRSAA